MKRFGPIFLSRREPKMKRPYMLKRMWSRPPCRNIEVNRIHGLAVTSEEMSMRLSVNKFPSIIWRANTATFAMMRGSIHERTFNRIAMPVLHHGTL